MNKTGRLLSVREADRQVSYFWLFSLIRRELSLLVTSWLSRYGWFYLRTRWYSLITGLNGIR